MPMSVNKIITVKILNYKSSSALIFNLKWFKSEVKHLFMQYNNQNSLK